MPTTMFSSQLYSISHSGMSVFQQGPFVAVMGSIMIDLVSAPLEPGEYQVEVSATMGSIEVFLPHYVQFTVEGGVSMGDNNVHEGPGAWEVIKQKLRTQILLPDQPPDYAIAQSNPERPVRIRFITHVTMGSVELYRL
jgi:Cell wall-active antibiotics response LiaF, C-terminal